jgi:hypothetical protein
MSPFASFLSCLFAPRYSLLACSFACPPREGRAERRWRLDACDAPRSARHDRRADASLDAQSGRARLAFVAHRGRTRRAIDFTTRASRPGLREASCVPSDGTLAFRRSTWDFWSGPVLAVVPPAPSSGGQARQRRQRRLEPPVRSLLSKLFGAARHALQDRAATFMPRGSSLPGGAGLANLPGAAANRLRGRHTLAPPCKNASGWRPSGARLGGI